MISIVLIAAFYTLALILMMVLPSHAKYESHAQQEKKRPIAQAARQQEINKAVSIGEVGNHRRQEALTSN